MPRVSERQFYAQLARKLRQADTYSTARAERDREAALEAGGVALADVLDLLTSDDDGGLTDELEARARGALAETHARLASVGETTTMGASVNTRRPQDSFYPDDAFDRRLAQFFDRRDAYFTPRAIDEREVPQAVVDALGSVADRTGILTPAAVERLGPTGQAIFQALRARLASVPALESDRDASKYESLGVVRQKQVARSRALSGAKERMPVLDEVSRLLGGENALRGFTMASVQHLFPSTRGLYAALGDNGLDVTTTGVGGKGYSTDMDVMMHMAASGFDMHRDGRVLAHRSGTSAAEVVQNLAREQLANLFLGVDPTKETKPRFLLLDEGGKLVKALHQYFPEYASLCVAVEQTDRGIQLLDKAKKKHAEEKAIFEATGAWPEPREGYELLCPVVNMARSEAKKTWESPMIGESCVFNLERQLDEMSPALRGELFADPARKQACVIGYGAVGKAVADRLRARGFDVWVHDTDPAKMAEAQADGCTPAPRDEALKHGTLTYGCTGGGVLEPADYDLLPDGAVLANAASGNHELGLDDIDIDREGGDSRQKVDDLVATSTFRGLDVELGEAEDPMRHRVWRTESGKEILLARSGYVVNMELDLPPEYAQLTRALLLASCLTAAKAEEPGLVDIPEAAQDFIVGRVNKHVAATGGSLAAPDFRELAPWD